MKKILLLTGSIAAIAAGAAIAQDKELTIVSWGGAYSQSQIKAYHEPYTEKTGVEILNEDKSANALAGIRSQVEAGNVTWDVVDMLQADAQRACDEGLVLEVPHDEWLAPAPDGTPASEDFIEGTLGPCFIPQILYSTMFAYNTEAFDGEGPQTIEDVWDLEKFPGTRALQQIPQKNLEWALIADGVAPADVYDVLATREGQDRAFAKLDQIKSEVVWWEAGAQPPQLLADGEVVMTTAYNGRVFNAVAAENKPFEIVWDGQVWDLDLWVIPKGAPNKDLALDFLAFSTETEQLAAQASWISYGPARKSSAPLVGSYATKPDLDMGPQMPTAPENFKNALQNDFEFWADNQDELNERFNAWLAQ